MQNTCKQNKAQQPKKKKKRKNTKGKKETQEASKGSASSLQQRCMRSVENPLKDGRTEAQATKNLELSIRASTLVIPPSKHLSFLSFQINQITVKKERCQKEFPLGEEMASLQPEK